MLHTYASKKAALRFAERAYGEQWQERARYLEIELPDNEMLYCIQTRQLASAPAGRSDRPQERRASPASKRIAAASAQPASDGIIKRMQAICNLMAGRSRADILEEAVRQGIARSTAATQYQRWRKSKGLVKSND